MKDIILFIRLDILRVEDSPSDADTGKKNPTVAPRSQPRYSSLISLSKILRRLDFAPPSKISNLKWYDLA